MMNSDREHIATLERLLKWSQGEVRSGEKHIEQLREWNCGAAALVLAATRLGLHTRQAEAIEWALEFVTRSER